MLRTQRAGQLFTTGTKTFKVQRVDGLSSPALSRLIGLMSQRRVWKDKQNLDPEETQHQPHPSYGLSQQRWFLNMLVFSVIHVPPDTDSSEIF